MRSLFRNLVARTIQGIDLWKAASARCNGHGIHVPTVVSIAA